MSARSIGSLLVLSVSLIIVLAVSLFVSDESADETVDLRETREVQVVLTDAGFEPRMLRVSKGTTVVFSTTRSNQFWPASNEHPAHTIYSDFDPKRPLAPEETWSFRFERVGEWGFHDHIRSYFTGVVYVE